MRKRVAAGAIVVAIMAAPAFADHDCRSGGVHAEDEFVTRSFVGVSAGGGSVSVCSGGLDSGSGTRYSVTPSQTATPGTVVYLHACRHTSEGDSPSGGSDVTVCEQMFALGAETGTFDGTTVTGTTVYAGPGTSTFGTTGIEDISPNQEGTTIAPQTAVWLNGQRTPVGVGRTGLANQPPWGQQGVLVEAFVNGEGGRYVGYTQDVPSSHGACWQYHGNLYALSTEENHANIDVGYTGYDHQDLGQEGTTVSPTGTRCVNGDETPVDPGKTGPEVTQEGDAYFAGAAWAGGQRLPIFGKSGVAYEPGSGDPVRYETPPPDLGLAVCLGRIPVYVDDGNVFNVPLNAGFGTQSCT